MRVLFWGYARYCIEHTSGSLGRLRGPSVNAEGLAPLGTHQVASRCLAAAGLGRFSRARVHSVW